MKKIVFFNAGSIQKFSTSLRSLAIAKQLVSNHNYELHYIVNYNSQDYEKYGEVYGKIRIHYIKDNFWMIGYRFGINPFYFLRLLFRILKRLNLLIKIAPDIVHVFKPLPYTFIAAKIYQMIKGGKLLLDIDDAEYAMLIQTAFKFDMYYRVLTKILENKGYLLCDHLTVASKFFYDFFKNKKANLTYIPNGVSPEEFKLDHPQKDLITYSGVFTPCYDSDLVIKIFSEAKNRRNHIKLLMIGDGSERKKLEELASKMKIKDSVSFTGYIDQKKVYQLLCKSNILIFPQRDNYVNRVRCPLKIREYMAAGRPVVATKIGEISEALADVDQLVSPGGIGEFVDRLVKFIDDFDLCRLKGRINRDRSKAFSWQKLAEKFAKIYESFDD